MAEAESNAKQRLAEGESKASELLGKGEAARIAQTGLSEAAVFLQKIRAYGDPRLFALNLVGEQLAHSAQPLVPERLFMVGGGKDGHDEQGGTPGVMGQLLALLLAERSGFSPAEAGKGTEELDNLARELTRHYATAMPVKANGERQVNAVRKN